VTDRIGPYKILRKLGEGGMGVVFIAEDERLHRAVAIKMIRDAGDSSARERFFREARAAASLNHPNVCQLFDIGDEDGKPFLVMELLEGEPLSKRLEQGALPLADATRIALAMVTALDALHGRGFIHRDLKPSNVFLTAHGVKLLDFGLARETAPALSPDATTMRPGSIPITVAGMIVGTPRYMAPEQLMSVPADARSDIFAAGVLLYEMVSGRPPFDCENPMKLFHALVYEQPPNLGGSASISAVNRIIHRAMAKRPEDRYQNAGAMAQDLREVMLISDASSLVIAKRVTRLIALPLRVLRSDPETDFLAQAIPEAVTTSLAGVSSLIVRSSMSASRFGATADLKTLATEADVDIALTGTLLRAGEQIRVTTQLVEVPGGTVQWSLTSQATMSDLFQLQDSLTQRIVESLELPLTEREAKLVRHDVPATPRAHEFYLRAGQQGGSPEAWRIARDLYTRALDEDPRYAPAWARLARIHLLLGKYGKEWETEYKLAESAARRALDLNPELPFGHYAYALIEVATGRALASTQRLLDAVGRGTNDPQIFSALVISLRYCGLLEASAAAHEQAKRLDPNVSTSASHSYWMLGRYDEALAAIDPDLDMSTAGFIYETMGRIDDAVAVFEDREHRFSAAGGLRTSLNFRIFDAYRAAVLGKKEAAAFLLELKDFPDPEGQYYKARSLARIGEYEAAVERVALAVENGFFCYPWFTRDAWLDPIRDDPRFVDTMRAAEKQWREAESAFHAHPGSRVLAVGA
jgi:serine/threonine protein kinase/tetratricopeptide (TPR) repeat protein